MGQQIIVGITVGLTIAGISALVGYLVSHGYNLRNQKLVTDKLNEHSTSIAQHLDQLTMHMADNDAHWTTRERDALTKQIDRIDENVQTLLGRP